MSAPSARNQWLLRGGTWPAVVCAIGGLALFTFLGSATRGYIPSRSLFVWWGSQWLDPGADAQHGIVVVLVAAWLFWRNLRARPASVLHPDRPADGAALAAMLAGTAFHVLGYAAQQNRLSIVGLLAFVWGVLALKGGVRWAGAAAFPVFFLLLAVPVSFLDTLGFHLRVFVTDTVYAAARAAGLELVRNGTQLFSPDGRYQYDVAAACSGIRSLVAMVALAMLVGYLSFRSWWAWLVLVLASIPCIVIANVLRVGAVVAAGEAWSHGAGERVHAWSGPLVFLCVLGLLLAFVPLLQRFGFTAVRSASEGLAPTAQPAGGSRLSPAIVASIVVLAVVGAALCAWRLDALPARTTAGVLLSADGSQPAELPAILGTEWFGRRADVTPEERGILPGDTGYSRRYYERAGHPGVKVFASIVLSGRDRTSIHRPELCLVAQGWTEHGRFLHTFETPAGPVPMTVLRIEHYFVDDRGRRATLRSLMAYCFVGSDGVAATHSGMIWRDALGRLRTLRADRWAYMVLQASAQGGDQAALDNMQQVLAGVWPAVSGGAARR